MRLRDDLLEPIPGDNPSGEELRYEPVYDEIKDARTEEPDLPQGDWQRERKTADFGRVIDLAEEAIATRSKDLQLAAWMAEALLREEGFQGFQEGLQAIQGLITGFWETLYPEIEDGDAEFRATPLEWLANYLDPSVRAVPLNAAGHSLIDYTEAQRRGDDGGDGDDHVTAADFDAAVERTPKAWYKEQVAAIQACLELIDAIDKEGDERLGASLAPSYSSLRDSIDAVHRVSRKILDKKLEEDPDPPEPEPVEEIAETAGEPGTAPTPAPVSVVPTTPAEAAARITDAARYLRQQDPRNPAPYTLLRGFRWAEVRRGGDPPDPRLLEAPPTPVRTRLKSLLLDRNWPALLEAAEDVMATPYGRGWLDLQRYVGTALAGLGDDYRPVRNLLLDALRGLLRDLPSLPDQTLMDDSPTANRETRAWLQSEGVWSEDGGAMAGGAPASSGGGGPIAAVVQQARSLARNGDPSRSVETLLGAAKSASHPRDAFLYRSEAAAIMVDHGLDAVAVPILDDILKAIEAHGLDRWEAGALVARPLSLLYRVRSAAGQPAQDLYEKICRLDPVQAVNLQGGGPGGSGAGPGAPTPGAQAPGTPEPEPPQAPEAPPIEGPL